MENKTSDVEVVCHICKHEHTVSTQNVLDVGADEKLKEKILNGEYFLFTCPDCRFEMKLNYSCMYQDAAIREYIYLSREPQREENKLQIEKNAAALAQGNTENGILRIVYSEEDLKEKIRIFDNGLDDRIVEICKGISLSQFPSTEDYYVTDIRYDNIGGKELLRLRCSDETEQYVLDFESIYEQLLAEYGELLPSLRGNAFCCVDLEYAATFLREL